MTLDQAIHKVAAEIDAHLQIARRRFEDSLIVNRAPAEHLELLLDWNEDYQQAWRVRTLTEIRANLLDPCGWEPVEPRDPSEAP